MANTITFNVASNAQPGITVNHMKYALYLQTDLSTIVAFQNFSPAHPARTVSFPGLTRSNYRFRLLETLPDNTTIVREMDYFDFVPGSSNIVYYPPVEIQADNTPGIVSTVGSNTSFVFDGTAGTFDWRGREIFVERVGQGTMQRGVQYSWDTNTGTFTLLTVGDTFQPLELFNVEFGLVTTIDAGVAPQQLFSGVRIITGTTTLTNADIGKKIIIKGASNSFDITLPDIAVCLESIPMYFESGIGSHIGVRIKTVSGQIIDWLKGSRQDIKMGVCESLAMYKNIDTAVSRWRIHEADGNFRTVGRFITTDGDPTANEFNSLLCDGSLKSTADYARLYEDFVLKLPVANVSSYLSHNIGTDKYKFSFASAGQFYLPDLRNVYLRNWDGTGSFTSQFQEMMMEEHRHQIGYLDGISGGVGGYGRNTLQPNITWGLLAAGASSSRGSTDKPMRQVTANTMSYTRADGSDISGTETRPKSRIVLFYVLT